MKISEMLEREDFYIINERTLNSFFPDDGCESKLYIYPKLNAIVTQMPGNDVVDYLLTEFSARSLTKRVAAKIYVRLCMLTRGVIAKNKLIVHHAVGNNTLVYPCNKKYRVFDFDKDIVSVVPKYGFKYDDLQHEIQFRSGEATPPFVPRILEYTKSSYSEIIIHGRPLARVSDSVEYNRLIEAAYTEFRNTYKDLDKSVDSDIYLDALNNDINSSLGIKQLCFDDVDEVIKKLIKVGKKNKTIVVGFSHGDLQPGNIWIENGTNKIYIIDWESWGERSVWYDKAVLFGHLRPGSILNYLHSAEDNSHKAVVILEDILFHLNELNSLPDAYGVEHFCAFYNTAKKWILEEPNNA